MHILIKTSKYIGWNDTYVMIIMIILAIATRSYDIDVKGAVHIFFFYTLCDTFSYWKKLEFYLLSLSNKQTKF